MRGACRQEEGDDELSRAEGGPSRSRRDLLDRDLSATGRPGDGAGRSNGDPTEFLCEPQQTLLDVLRDELQLTGSKEGCASGDCGACSVTLDGRLVCSCLVLAVEAEGRSVETIEGMADGEGLHPLQRHFLEQAALQCGVCTPGFLVAAKALLDRNPAPSETEIRYWLAGNLCRCTGYLQIYDAIEKAAEDMRGAKA